MSLDLILERSSPTGEDAFVAPSWAEIGGVLDSLDGVIHSEVFLGNDKTEGIIVVGGPDRFVVWVQRWDSTGRELAIDTALDPTASSGTVRFQLSNGQVDVFPLTQTVDRLTMVHAVRTFHSDGRPATDIQWEHQGENGDSP